MADSRASTEIIIVVIFFLPEAAYQPVGNPLVERSSEIQKPCGNANEWHWMVLPIGLGLLSFAMTQGTNVSFVYCIDSFPPVAGEVTVTQQNK
ncbi:hypothetical protein BJX62DRAFT_236969 [Aspergillus germanicus]